MVKTRRRKGMSEDVSINKVRSAGAATVDPCLLVLTWRACAVLRRPDAAGAGAAGRGARAVVNATPLPKRWQTFPLCPRVLRTRSRSRANARIECSNFVTCDPASICCFRRYAAAAAHCLPSAVKAVCALCAMAARLARLARHVIPVATPGPSAATERRTSGSAGGSPTAHSPANLDRRYLDDEDDGEMDLHDDYFPVEMSESEKFMFDLQGVRPLARCRPPHPSRPPAPPGPLRHPTWPLAPGTWPPPGTPWPPPGTWLPVFSQFLIVRELPCSLTDNALPRRSSSSSASFSAGTRSAR